MIRAFVVVLFFPATTMAAEFVGRVVGVHDGDSITVLDQTHTQHKIRLAGIDAPEIKQPFGRASKKHLSDLVYNREVRLVCSKLDRYRRQICVVNIESRDVNLAQVKAGMAWWYQKYRKEQSADQQVRYEAAETTARSIRVGLWKDSDPVAPWDFRKNR